MFCSFNVDNNKSFVGLKHKNNKSLLENKLCQSCNLLSHYGDLIRDSLSNVVTTIHL